MRILYIGNFADRDSPLGYCPNAWYITDTFRRLGHLMTTMNECDVTAEDILTKLKEADSEGAPYHFILTEEARLKGDFKNSPEGTEDLVLGLFQEVMDKADQPIVAWISNIFYGIMRREIQVKTNPIFKADIVFSTDGGHQKEFEEAGVDHVNLRMGIHLPEAVLGEPVYPTTAQIAFVGSIYDEIWPYRKELVEWLKKTYGDKFIHVGQRGEVRHKDLNDLCATVKIVVGDSVFSPNYWSNRIYEIIGRGGFLIHPMIPGLEDEFTPYRHFIPYTYNDFVGLKEKIDFFLTHDREREQVKMAGFYHCQRYHTYDQRVKKLIDIIKAREIV